MKASGDVQTPSSKQSAGGGKKHGVCRECRTCTTHNTLVMYVTAGREVRAGQRLYMPGRPLSLHERLPIQKIGATGALHVPLLHQYSRPTLAKTSRRPKKSPKPAITPYPQSFSSKTHQSSYPVSSQEDRSCLPYQRAPTPPTRP